MSPGRAEEAGIGPEGAPGSQQQRTPSWGDPMGPRNHTWLLGDQDQVQDLARRLLLTPV